jgi:ribosomal protein S18 acetylase RimI-like enzyme
VPRDDATRVQDGEKAAIALLYTALDDARFEQRDGYLVAIAPSLPMPPFNAIWGDGGGSAGLAEAVAEVEAASGHCWFFVRVGVDDELIAAARELGFTTLRPEPGMVVRPDELADAGVPELEIEPATDEAALAEAVGVAATGFGGTVDGMRPLYTQAVAGLPGMEIYVARMHGQPVSTGVGAQVDGGVGIFSVATPPEHRGRGYAGAVTAHACRRGFEAGADLAWLNSSELGHPVYRRLGFRDVATFATLARPAP